MGAQRRGAAGRRGAVSTRDLARRRDAPPGLRLDFPPCPRPPTPLRVLARSDDVWTLVAARGGEIVCVKQAARPGGLAWARETLGAEACVLARLGPRPGSTPRLLETGTTPGGLPFLVLEHHDGVPLAAVPRWPGAGTSETLLVAVLRGVLAALALVARRVPGLVHRDVSPGNVLLGIDGRVLLVDFGIALFPGRARRTRPRAVRGTPDFLAPEQLRGEPLDARTDLYALALTAYVAATGRSPFVGRTVDERAAAKLAGAALPIEAVRRDVHPALAGWFARALARAPRARFGCAEEAMGALPRHTAADLASSVHSATLRVLAARRVDALHSLSERACGELGESPGEAPAPRSTRAATRARDDIVCHAKKLTR